MAIIVTLLGLSFAVLLIIFLASAALFESVYLTIGCILGVFIFFYALSVLNKKQES
jgi:hypothetical protein